MKKFRVVLFILLILTRFVNLAHAEIKLPAIFCNHMVLQQQAEVLLWGNALPDKKVKVNTSWNNEKYTTIADNSGNWKQVRFVLRRLINNKSTLNALHLYRANRLACVPVGNLCKNICNQH